MEAAVFVGMLAIFGVGALLVLCGERPAPRREAIEEDVHIPGVGYVTTDELMCMMSGRGRVAGPTIAASDLDEFGSSTSTDDDPLWDTMPTNLWRSDFEDDD